jgi:hypothetical protein
MTSKTAPKEQRTSLASPCPLRRCKPRSTPRAERVAVLDEGSRIDPGGPHDGGVESPGEEAALVHVRCWPEQHGASDSLDCDDVPGTSRTSRPRRQAGINDMFGLANGSCPILVYQGDQPTVRRVATSTRLPVSTATTLREF